MSDPTPEAAAPEVAPASPAKEEKPKKEKKVEKPKIEKVKKEATVPVHPPVAEMVIGAVTALNEKGGSSSVNIKKYLTSEYKVDVDKLSTYIRKALRNAVLNGKLLQTKGKNGSFKLPYYVKSKNEKTKNDDGSKKAGRGRPKKDDLEKPKKEAKVKAAPKKEVAKKTKRGRPAAKKVIKAKPKAEAPKTGSPGKGRGRPKQDPLKIKANPVPTSKGRGRPRRTAE